MKLAILAALPRELGHVIQELAATKSADEWAFPVHAVKTASSEILIVQTGMGMERAGTALGELIKRFMPDCIISAGFAGALYADASPGDLIWGTRIFRYPAEGRAAGTPGPLPLSAEMMPAIPLPEPLAERLSAISYLKGGCIITLEKPMEKKVLALQLPAGLSFPVCDMETFALAEVSTAGGIPFLAVRTISDTLDEEVPQELIGIVDEMGQPKLGRLFHAVTTNPALVTDVIRLRRNSDIGSRNLGRFVKELLPL